MVRKITLISLLVLVLAVLGQACKEPNYAHEIADFTQIFESQNLARVPKTEDLTRVPKTGDLARRPKTEDLDGIPRATDLAQFMVDEYFVDQSRFENLYIGKEYEAQGKIDRILSDGTVIFHNKSWAYGKNLSCHFINSADLNTMRPDIGISFVGAINLISTSGEPHWRYNSLHLKDCVLTR